MSKREKQVFQHYIPPATPRWAFDEKIIFVILLLIFLAIAAMFLYTVYTHPVSAAMSHLAFPQLSNSHI